MKEEAYYFLDNWYGDTYSFPTLSAAKKEAAKHTFGHSVPIHQGMEIVAVVEPRERPLP